MCDQIVTCRFMFSEPRRQAAGANLGSRGPGGAHDFFAFVPVSDRLWRSLFKRRKAPGPFGTGRACAGCASRKEKERVCWYGEVCMVRCGVTSLAAHRSPWLCAPLPPPARVPPNAARPRPHQPTSSNKRDGSAAAADGAAAPAGSGGSGRGGTGCGARSGGRWPHLLHCSRRGGLELRTLGRQPVLRRGLQR